MCIRDRDKEMEKRGLNFVRYADDCIIMVGSEMSANRVMRNISPVSYTHLRSEAGLQGVLTQIIHASLKQQPPVVENPNVILSLIHI